MTEGSVPSKVLSDIFGDDSDLTSLESEEAVITVARDSRGRGKGRGRGRNRGRGSGNGNGNGNGTPTGSHVQEKTITTRSSRRSLRNTEATLPAPSPTPDPEPPTSVKTGKGKGNRTPSSSHATKDKTSTTRPSRRYLRNIEPTPPPAPAPNSEPSALVKADKGKEKETSPKSNTKDKTITTHPSRQSLRTTESTPPPPPASAPNPETPPAVRTPNKRRLSETTLSSNKRPRTSESSVSKASKGKQSVLSPSRSTVAQLPRGHMDIYTANDIVWVRLDVLGELMQRDDPDAELSYWWPAQVTNDDPICTIVRTFGNDGHGGKRTIDVDSPSSSILLPLKEGEDLRFTEDTFVLYHDEQASTSENASKLVSNIRTRWVNACAAALEAEKEEDFPTDLAGLLKNSSMLFDSVKKSPQAESTDSLPEDLTPSRSRKRRAITPLDESITPDPVDGELVIAKDQTNRGDYWPAQVLAVYKDDKSGRWLYRLRYIDGKRKGVSRSKFYSAEEDGFATSQLGEWVTSYAEKLNLEDDTKNVQRTPSPPPSDPGLGDITNLEDFIDLDISGQLRYVYPFLCKVIEGKYEPALPRHDAFLKGGKSRDTLAKSADRGSFTEREMEYIGKLVRRTMLQDERWAERVEDGDRVDGRSAEDSAVAPTAMDVVAENPPEASSSSGSDLLPSEAEPNEKTGSESNNPADQDVIMTDNIAATSSPYNMDVDNITASNTLEDIPTTETNEKAAENKGTIDIQPARPIKKRPTGGTEYEQLSRSDRGMYCTDVLLPEAVIQLHLFRRGLRKSTQLLAPDEEKRLYAQGVEIAAKNEVPWSTRLIELRNMMRNKLEKKRAKKSLKKAEVVSVVTGGTSTRPKVSVTRSSA
ncbi:hypothetical protein M422DRAFT_30483 [Sphaerobolus stellatus SS14]|uniref:Uncharacterized protein n=1 Tax=Sphaerobolus stellatus (strain SS14) TaxID=990650 RepID=A0A0C9VBK0_SPHS4|nr:hypothetical protein M422DRAFT_30483 [Sphaerobolus stellatus SS14]